MSQKLSNGEVLLMVAYLLEEHRVRFSINIATLIGHEDADVPASMILPYQKFL